MQDHFTSIPSQNRTEHNFIKLMLQKQHMSIQ